MAREEGENQLPLTCLSQSTFVFMVSPLLSNQIGRPLGSVIRHCSRMISTSHRPTARTSNAYLARGSMPSMEGAERPERLNAMPRLEPVLVGVRWRTTEI